MARGSPCSCFHTRSASKIPTQSLSLQIGDRAALVMRERTRPRNTCPHTLIHTCGCTRAAVRASLVESLSLSSCYASASTAVPPVSNERSRHAPHILYRATLRSTTPVDADRTLGHRLVPGIARDVALGARTEDSQCDDSANRRKLWHEGAEPVGLVVRPRASAGSPYPHHGQRNCQLQVRGTHTHHLDPLNSLFRLTLIS